jgi:pimeloyl-ACP methyl ester carboxylesterase
MSQPDNTSPPRVHQRLVLTNHVLQWSRRFVSVVVLGLVVRAATANAQVASTIDGHWQGVMERERAVLAVRFDFQTGHDSKLTGRFTSETQRALEYPLDTVSASADGLHWELGGGSLIFDGTVSPGAITGTFREGQARGTFQLRPVQPLPPPYERKDVTFRSGEAQLAGTLLRPRGPGRHAGIVFLHGSGPESRWGTNLFLADQFARHGVAALVFDKRGVGQSTGDWKTANYQDLAEDYLAAVHLLQQQPGVSASRVGIYGHSQGATLSPLIASQKGAVAFVIAAAAIGTDAIYEQDVYRTRNDLVDGGLVEPALSRAMALYTQWLTVARTGEGWDALERAMSAAKGESWFRSLGLPPKGNWIYQWYPAVGSFDPLPLWEHVEVPVLLLYGERDRNTPVEASLHGIGSALKIAHNADVTPVIIPGAVHNLTIQWQPGQPFFWWHAAPGYSELLISWVQFRFSGPR